MERSLTSRRSGRGWGWSPVGSGSGPLDSAVGSFRSAAKAMERAAVAEAEAGEALLKWGLAAQANAAVRDVLSQTRELLDLPTLLAAALRSEMESPLGGLVALKETGAERRRAEKALRGAEADYQKLKKELGKTEKWGKGGDAALLRHRLAQAAAARDAANAAVAAQRAEEEAAILLRLRSSLDSIGTVFGRYATGLGELSSAIADVAAELPGISTEDVGSLCYQGTAATSARVGLARERLGLADRDRKAARRRSAPPTLARHRKVVDIGGGMEALAVNTQLHSSHHRCSGAPGLAHSSNSVGGGLGPARHSLHPCPQPLPDFNVPPPAYAPFDPHAPSSRR